MYNNEYAYRYAYIARMTTIIMSLYKRHPKDERFMSDIGYICKSDPMWPTGCCRIFQT